LKVHISSRFRAKRKATANMQPSATSNIATQRANCEVIRIAIAKPIRVPHGLHHLFNGRFHQAVFLPIVILVLTPLFPPSAVRRLPRGILGLLHSRAEIKVAHYRFCQVQLGVRTSGTPEIVSRFKRKGCEPVRAQTRAQNAEHESYLWHTGAVSSEL
jgi:hypothetical protein